MANEVRRSSLRYRTLAVPVLADGLVRLLVLLAVAAFINASLKEPPSTLEELWAPVEVVAWVSGGLVAGWLLTGFQKHPRRVLGLVPFGLSGMAAGLLLASLTEPCPVIGALLGVCGGLVLLPVTVMSLVTLPTGMRGSGKVRRAWFDYALFFNILLFVILVWKGRFLVGQLWPITGVATVGALLSWWLLLREAMELTLEIILWPIYRIRGHGPGLSDFPLTGPVLVVGNHTAWMDPLWLAKLLPRRTIPMMTSVFYDLPVLRWLMFHIAHAIRVQASTYRREAPELAQAVAALDRGECVVMFPEGGMRRREQQPLKQFGQGVWHILKERPETPVVVCWIEGGWGSYFSYFNGLPTKNKRFDWWRRIDVAVSPPQQLAAELLGDQRATRRYLMQACLEARRHLGLEPYSLAKLRLESGRDETSESPEIA
jgi:1-acyl-sn-glycerol-3-phosphate acyltransferase